MQEPTLISLPLYVAALLILLLVVVLFANEFHSLADVILALGVPGGAT